MIYKWGVDVNVWSRKSPAHVDGGTSLEENGKKSKKMTVAFGGILVMSVVIGGCGGREDAKRALRSAYLFMTV